MPIFSGIAAAIGAVSTFAAGFGAVGTFALQAAVGVGLSFAARALAGKPAQPAAGPGFSVQGKLQAGGAVPRSFILGKTATAGSLVYANTWGNLGETPNAYLTQVIAVSDMPVAGLAGVLVNGIDVTLLPGEARADYGTPIAEYRKALEDGPFAGAVLDHLWIKFYDGTQPAADSFVVGSVSSSERPYGPDRIGKGVAYVIVTALVNDKLFTGFPELKFVVQGTRLYDPTKDPTAGGTGTHDYSNPTTWGGDGDDLPAVQLYNLMRGIRYNGEWVYGLQNATAATLPVANWQTQIDKCRALIKGPDGNEATYLSGGEIAVSSQIADCAETILTTCHGKMAEIGGTYKLRVGAPDAPVMSFSDGDILSTEEQSFTPFFGLSDTVTGITGKHPSPAEAWAVKSAPPLYRGDLEALAGNRRLLSDVSFDFVYRDAQVQRLMKSALGSAQRARRHTFSLPPQFWLLEPLDVVEWTSERNGYIAKLMEVDGLIDQANLDVTADLTEVDPADYDWDQNVDFTNPTRGPVVFVRPDAQAILDWFASAIVIEGGNGARRAALMLEWDGSQPDVAGVAFEVRNAADLSVIHRGRTDNPLAGQIIISQSILPNTEYGVRGRYIPANPRDTLWSSWLPVTTPDVKLSLEEFEAWIRAQILELQNQNSEEFDRIRAALSQAGNTAAQTHIQRAKLKGETRKITDRIAVRVDNAEASIEQVQEVAVDNEAAIAQLTMTVQANYDDSQSQFQSIATAFSTRDVAFSNYQITTNASLGSLSSSVSVQASAIADLNGMVASRFAVTLDTNGYASGFELINGGQYLSAFNVRADRFAIQLPGYGGVTPFVVGTINGSPGIGLTGAVFLDGTLHARAIQAGTVDAIQIKQDGIPISKLIADQVSKAYTTTLGSPVQLATVGAGGQWSSETTLLSVNCAALETAVLTINGLAYAQSFASVTTLPGGTNWKVAHEQHLMIRIYVDGGVVYEQVYFPNFISAYSPGGAFAPDVPMMTNYSMPLVLARGVTAGAHNVQVRALWQSGYGLYGPTFKAGGITVHIHNKVTLN